MVENASGSSFAGACVSSAGSSLMGACVSSGLVALLLLLPQAHRDRHITSAKSREIAFFIVGSFFL